MINIPPEKITEYTEAFNLFDINNTGEIHITLLNIIILSVMSNYNENILKKILEDYKKNNINYISLKDFIIILDKISNQSEISINEIIECFKTFDTDNSSKISLKSFKNIMTNLGNKLDINDVDEIISELDNDGFINYIEFIKTIMLND